MACRFVVGRGNSHQDIIYYGFEAVGRDVHHAGQDLARRGVLQVFQVEGFDVAAAVHIDHAARLAFAEELVNADTQLRAVRQVVCHRRLPPDFVTQLHGAGLYVEFQLREPLVEQHAEETGFRHFAQFGMTVRVVGEVNTARGEFRLAQFVEHAFGYDRRAVVHADDPALDDGRNHQTDDLVDGDRRFVEHFGNDDHRVVARLADTEGQVSGTAAHRRHDEPVAAGAGIDIDGPGDHRTLVFSRFVAEGRRAVGQRKVVVDGFRDMYVGDRMTLFFQKFGHAVGRRCRVVAADGHQQLDVVLGEELPVETLLEIFVRRFEAAHAQERTREVENFVRFEEGDVLRGGRFAEEPCETFVESDDAVSLLQEGFCHAAHYRIHARCRAAARENGDRFVSFGHIVSDFIAL